MSTDVVIPTFTWQGFMNALDHHLDDPEFSTLIKEGNCLFATMVFSRISSHRFIIVLRAPELIYITISLYDLSFLVAYGGKEISEQKKTLVSDKDLRRLAEIAKNKLIKSGSVAQMTRLLFMVGLAAKHRILLQSLVSTKTITLSRDKKQRLLTFVLENDVCITLAPPSVEGQLPQYTLEHLKTETLLGCGYISGPLRELVTLDVEAMLVAK